MLINLCRSIFVIVKCSSIECTYNKNESEFRSKIARMELFGKCLASMWQVFGKNLANTWQIFGKYLASFWHVFDKYLGSLGKGMVITWQAFAKCSLAWFLQVPWQAFGK